MSSNSTAVMVLAAATVSASCESATNGAIASLGGGPPTSPPMRTVWLPCDAGGCGGCCGDGGMARTPALAARTNRRLSLVIVNASSETKIHEHRQPIAGIGGGQRRQLLRLL